MGRMTICTDIYAALAECCLFHREHELHGDTDPTSNGSAKPGAVLVIVHPRHLPDLGAVRLVETVRNYAPSVALWRYDRSANPKLRAIVEEDVTTGFATAEQLATPEPVVVPVARPHVPSVQTRIVENFSPKHTNGTGHAEPAATPAPPTASGGSSHAHRGARATTLLTEDELRMLLSGDPFDGGPLGARSHHPPRSPSNGGAP